MRQLSREHGPARAEDRNPDPKHDLDLLAPKRYGGKGKKLWPGVTGKNSRLVS